MTLPKRGSRRIVVDGVVYVWSIRRKVTYSDIQSELGDPSTGARIRVNVERVDGSGSVLVVTTPFSRRSGVSELPMESVRPAHVAGYIREAVARGWGHVGGRVPRSRSFDLSSVVGSGGSDGDHTYSLRF